MVKRVKRAVERRKPKNANLRKRIDALKERHETALQETRHRFANCFQLLSALILFRSRHAKSAETREHLARLHDQVVTLALLQKQVISAGDRAAFGFFLAEQVALWRALCAERGVEIVVEAEDIELGADTATPLGLIVHELVANCLEHAFPDSTGGTIRIRLARAENGQAHLIVTDDGSGLPRDLDRTASFGLRLVERLATQVNGIFQIESGSGTTARVCFPLRRSSGTGFS